jgi:DNA-binding beta-propeller fold protein YncE
VDQDGNIYVPDIFNHRIQKFDKDGNFLVAWGTEGVGDGQFDKPFAVTVDDLGKIYVADTHNHRIQVFGGPYLDIYIGERPVPERTLWLAPPSLRQ